MKKILQDFKKTQTKVVPYIIKPASTAKDKEIFCPIGRRAIGIDKTHIGKDAISKVTLSIH